MKEIIWVFGVSAVGKEAFCRYITNNPTSELLSKINIASKRIAVSEISTRATGKFTGDPLVRERENIPKEVSNLLNDHDVVFIKWQYTDTTEGIFKEVEEVNPSTIVKIVLLQASEDIIASRLLSKEWWQNENSQEDPMQNVLDEQELVQEQLSKLNNKYSVVTLHSDTNFNFY